MFTWKAFQDSGLLWMLNTTVLHPRGLAMVIHLEDGEAVGWSILGDGGEVWVFEEETAEKGFVKFQNFLKEMVGE